MRNLNKYLALALATVALSSCDDLDTEYLGTYVTDAQKNNTYEMNPDMGVAAVNSMFSCMKLYGTVSSYHYDFGYAAIMLGLDSQGSDLVGPNSGYNWFRSWESYSSPNQSGTPTAMMWYHMYDQIFTANNVLETYTKDNIESDVNKFYRANGLAVRAFCYWNLAQVYQFNYEGHEDSPCVPIITAENKAEYAEKGGPRATVREVYDLIISDLTEAIELFSESGTSREDVNPTQSKSLISIDVAYGLRARAYLTMHKYAEAAQDAQQAIKLSDATPYSRSDVSKPTFANIDDNSWMWGIDVAETDRIVTTGIINFPSHMGSFAYGYCTVGAWRACDQRLYAQIPSSDVRKGWFLDDNLVSKNLTKAQQAYLDGYSTIKPYTQVKFDSYQSVINQSTSANDIPLMRIEEMYYILYEGQAMSGDVAAAKEGFQNFINVYRNAKYTVSATTPEDLQEEIYQDRRVEFFGEGLSYFDLMRLNKDIDRTNSNWPAAFAFYIPMSDPDLSKVRIYCIPSGEITGNPQISSSDNNPSGNAPSAL
jgi:tetratricopeptide (TPR) repeat protein